MKAALLYVSLALVVFFSPAFPKNTYNTPHVVNPHLSTDRSIDCTSIDRILDSLIKEGMNS